MKSLAAGALLHSIRNAAPAVLARRTVRALSLAGLACAALAGCGNNYRPVVSAIATVGPAGQPSKYAVVVSGNGPTANGLVTIVDFSGDTILDTTALGLNPYYFTLDSSGSEGYTLNCDGTLTSFPVSTSLIASQVLQSTLFPNTIPAGTCPAVPPTITNSIYSQGSSLYITEIGRNAVAQATGLPPGIKQELPTGPGTVYTVGSASAPRAYAIVRGTLGTAGHVAAIETTLNTLSATIPVGVNPVYGVMTADARRAFILNNGSNSVSVINSQTNALDSFHTGSTITGTIPVGVAPIWADFAPTLSELVVANAGNGTTPGSLSIISIPLCNSVTVTSNPNCDTANPVDAVGFGTVVATVPVGVNPIMVAVLADGTRAYVANAGNAALGIAGSVSVVNLTSNTVTQTIPFASSTNSADAIGHGHPNWIALTNSTPTGKVYVTAADSTDLTVIRTDTDTVQTHVGLQGFGVSVRMTSP